ncbi:MULTISPECIES: ABC transporter permease [unclassified Carboxylicivirga]|uniref:ABC transporter permease n=1 Tax=Carboxylicivirga TaxID=1628153 RepID=UPI003D32604E
MVRYKIILRQLLRHPSNTLIRVVSLVIGLSVSLLIFLQIAHQLNFDDFHPDKDRMHRIAVVWNNKGEIDDGPVIIAPLAQALEENIPEVEEYALIRKGWNTSFYTEEKKAINAKALYADSTFFSFFHFPIIQRTTNNELTKPYRLLISQSTANKFFGETDALGKVIYDTNQKPFQVEGIFQDVPANSHLDFDIVVSFETIRAEGKMYTGWGGGDSFNGYVKLIPGANVASVEEQIPDVIAKYYDATEDIKAGQTETFYLQQLNAITTAHDTYNTLVLSIMGVIGIIILLVSVLNYVLLTLSSFQKQVYNLGIQQFSGASKADIVKIIIREQVLMVMVSSAIVALMIKPMLVISADVWGWCSSILYNRYSIVFTIFILGFVLLLAIGLPLIRLQRKQFRLALVKKGFSRMEALSKRILLVGQMVGATVLMIILFMLMKQLHYIERMQLGYTTANRLYVQVRGVQNHLKAPVLLDQLQKLSFVESASASSQLLMGGLSGNSFKLPGNEEDYWISRFMFVDKHFHSTMGVKLVNGEYLSAFDDTEPNVVIINQALARMMNWDHPVGQEIQSNFSNQTFRIVGVVEDCVKSAHVRKQPAIFYKIPPQSLTDYANYISICLQPGTSAAQINQIKDLLKTESSMVPMQLQFYDTKVANYYRTERRLKRAIMVFAGLAMFLALIGLAGFVLNEVQYRTKEIGIRKVNGATISEVLIMLNQDFTRWVVLAILIACPLGYFMVEQAFRFYAYKTELSWWIFVLAGMVSLGMALLTVSVQSWKAARRNPVESLRYE